MWSGRATAYLDSFAALCAHPAPAVLDAAEVGDGVRLLDVGTGTGTVAALAASRGARVVAVDADAGMLAVGRRLAPTMTVCRAALPDLPFAAGSFDAATANFVINHVGDPAAALIDLRRVVRLDGRVAVTIWPDPPPPAQRLWQRVFDAAGVARPVDLPRVASDRDFPRTREGLSGLLSGSGFARVRCEVIRWTHRADPDAWWSGPAGGIGTAGILLGRQDPVTVERVRARYDEVTASYRELDGRLALPTAALLASAIVA
jgi:SAM-dependent methyltransferase